MNELKPIVQNNQRVLLTSQLAERYGVTEKMISNNFNNNSERYKEGRDYYRIEGPALRDFLQSSNLGLQNPSKIRVLYLWTEHGALLHAKSLGTDEAWEVYAELVNTYFRAREITAGRPQASPEKPSLETKAKADRAVAMKANALTRRAKEFRKVCEAAGVDPNYIALGFFKICQGKDVDLPELGVTVDSPTYDQKQIAEKLGILSSSGKPHAQAVGCILGELKLEESEIERVPFESHGHADTYLRYKESVLNKVAGWLEENQFPQTLYSRNKRFKVCYSHQSVSK